MDETDNATWLPVWWHARDRQSPGIDPLGGGLGATLQQFCLIRSLAILFYPLHLCGQYSCVGATI